MSRFNLASVGLVAVFCLSLAAVTQADTMGIPVPNGDFSSPPTSTYILGAPAFWSDTEVDASGVAVGGMNGSSDQFFFQGLSGSDFEYLHQVDIGAAFVVGDTYTLDFYYANGQINPYTLTANICYNAGNSAVVTQGFEVAASQGWTHGSISGVPTSDMTGQIGIVFKFAGSWGLQQPWLDHVTLTRTSAIPEPSAVMLLTTGLLGLSAYAWRKRR
jgi:hypothetical protein